MWRQATPVGLCSTHAAAPAALHRNKAMVWIVFKVPSNMSQSQQKARSTAKMFYWLKSCSVVVGVKLLVLRDMLVTLPICLSFFNGMTDSVPRNFEFYGFGRFGATDSMEWVHSTSEILFRWRLQQIVCAWCTASILCGPAQWGFNFFQAICCKID